MRTRLPISAALLAVTVSPDVGIGAEAEAWTMAMKQTIVRAPKAKVVEAALANGNDEALAKIVREWVKDGTAREVSELGDTQKMTSSDIVKLKAGQEVEVVVEYEQDMEQGKVVPEMWDTVFIGTSVEATVLNRDAIGRHRYVEVNWETRFTPRGLDMVRWPAWWPTLREAKVNWFGHPDHYEQTVSTQARFVAGREVVVGIMRRADEVVAESPRPPEEETLDVMLATIAPERDGKAPRSLNTKKEDEEEELEREKTRARCTVLAYSLKDHEAITLLGKTGTLGDAALLEELQKMTAEGKATLRSFTAVNVFRGARSKLTTVRQQQYPTEMPTIPSAWDTRPSGTIVELELSKRNEMTVSFEHHPAAARKREWRCAVDSPELVLWQPQFFANSLVTGVTFDEKGVMLLGAMTTPECQAGAKGITPGETMVVMAKLDGVLKGASLAEADAAAPVKVPIVDPYAPPVIPPKVEAKPPAAPSPKLEVDVVIFDIPAAEKLGWETPTDGLSDGQRFNDLMARAKEGKDVKIAAHLTVAGRTGERCVVKAIEEVKVVTEATGQRTPGRYRPTGIEPIDTGTMVEFDPYIHTSQEAFDFGAPVIYVNCEVQHAVSPPREVDFRKAIEASEKDLGVPEAEYFREHWRVENALVRPGSAKFIGVQTPPGKAMKGRLHVMFLRGRMGKETGKGE